MAQHLEHAIAAVREHTVATSAGRGTERMGEEGLADADGPDDSDVRVGLIRCATEVCFPAATRSTLAGRTIHFVSTPP